MNNLKKHKKGNPFVYGETVTGNNFTDREDEMVSLERDMRDGQTVFLISPRRYGKTSLILNLFRHLDRRDCMTVYVDLYRCASLTQFLNQYLTQILKVSETGTDRIARFLKDLLPALRPKIIVHQDGSISAEVGLSPTEKNYLPYLVEVIDLPHRIASRRKKTMVIAWDEFQEIRNYNGESLEKAIRSIIQHHRNVGYLFAGSKRHVLRDMIFREDRAFYKSGKVMTLKEIPRPEFVKFINRKFTESGFVIGPDVAEDIMTAAHDCPYFIQYLCHEIWDSYHEVRKVDKKDVRETLRKIVAEESPVYLTIWNDLTLPQRRLLQAIASDTGKGIFSQDYLVRHELGSSSSVQTSSHLLIEKGILDRENGDFFLEDVFFKHWIVFFGSPA
jgi:AAA+ ATPase superfamily predicted ATPase